jgi:hypothetical protein
MMIAGCVAGGLCCAWIGYSLLMSQTAEQRYRAAALLADRLDPSWREGISPNASEVIADDENSALLVIASYEQIPRGWQPLKGQWPPLLLDPRVPLAPKLLADLKSRREEARDGLADARKLTDRPRGRFPGWRVEVPRSVPRSRQQVETVAQLLYIDALIRIEEGDLAGLAGEVKAMINAGRALGDEPMLAAQAGRVMAVKLAVATLERLLAKGELPGIDLTGLQTLLEDEARHPLALVTLRGERAATEKLFNDVRDGRAGVAALFDSPGRSLPAIIYSWRSVRENQTLHLAHATKMVEIAKQPDREQGPALEKYGNAVFGQQWNDAGLLQKVYTAPFHENFSMAANAGRWQTAHHAAVNLAILALASERFRLDHGRWPKLAGELVPSYVKAVPYDPHTGTELRWKQTDKALAIYSVGLDGVDDGALRPRVHPLGRNNDVGFALEAPEDRGRPAVSKP